ncbi:MAG: hypothetical protein KJ706_03955 [Candidatus Omnitrophica bacterium]|nr:hypothetical protein [Candidatus Omnitrophota bacterium]
MNIERRLEIVEDKICVTGGKTIYISTAKDYVLYCNGKFPDDVEAIFSEPIRKIIECHSQNDTKTPY